MKWYPFGPTQNAKSFRDVKSLYDIVGSRKKADHKDHETFRDKLKKKKKKKKKKTFTNAIYWYLNLPNKESGK